MSKYLMNKLIHLVNMNEKAEEKYMRQSARVRRRSGRKPRS